MAEDTNTQPNVEDTQVEVNAGTQPTTTNNVENKKEVKTYSQEEVDSQMKKTRLATEKDAKKSILSQLGLTLDDEDKLNAFKEAYQNSLSDEEKKATELTNLQNEKIVLQQSVEEKDYIIKALFEMTGKKEDDVSKIVKMAKGLKTEDNTIEDAIRDVIKMINPVTPSQNVESKVENPNMPHGNAIEQPSTVSIDVQNNPFKSATYNLTEQGKLLKTNPELARKLAGEAGIKLNF